jgi:uncharacterized protein YkwD
VKKIMNKIAKYVTSAGLILAALLAGGGTASAELSQNDKDRFLTEHNVARAQVGTAPLQWDENLAADAQRWANNVVNNLWTSTNPHDQSIQGIQGENIGRFSSSSWNPSTPGDPLQSVQQWYNEKRLHDANPGPVSWSDPWGHWSQMVWKNTTKVGCASATVSTNEGREHKTAVVCRYNPPGNMVGETPV